MSIRTLITARLGTGAAIHLAMAVVGVAIAAVGWGFDAATRFQVTEVDAHREGCLEVIANADEDRARYRHLSEQIEAEQRSIAMLHSKLPQVAEESQFLKQLSELSSSAGVTLNDFRPGSPVLKADCKELTLQIRGVGPYAGWCRLLAGLKEIPRMVRVSQLTIAAPSQAGGDCTGDLQLHLLFGVQKLSSPTDAVQP